MEIEFNPKTLFHKDPWVLEAYYKVRYFFKYKLGKPHRHLVKEAFKGEPWDHSYLYSLERAKIEEMIAWHTEKQRFVGVEQVIHDMKICLSLIDIILGKRELSHIEGKLLSVPTEEKGMYKIVESPDFKLVVDVYTNTKNIDRFVKTEKEKEIYLKHLDELYVLKARHLYHKIRCERDQTWWD